MSASQSHQSELSNGQDKIVIDPASRDTIARMGILFLILTIILFYLLVASWPVLDETKAADGAITREFRPFNILGLWCYWAPDRQMLFTVMMSGALGSLVYSLTSFADYVGNKELSANWVWFFILRVPIGIAIALLFYFIIRGGILIPTVQVQSPAVATNASNATLYVNPYSIAAFSALAGMFSRQATDKLAAVFDAVFAMKKPVDREGALGSTQQLKLVPASLVKGRREDVTVTGSGFQAGTKATIGGKERNFTVESASQGRLAILDEDVKNIGELELVITNPNKDTFKATIKVVETDGKPVISDTEPKPLPRTATLLTVNGQGFQIGCVAIVGGRERKPSAVADKKITIPLEAADFSTPSPLKLVIKNPGGAAAEVSIDFV
jgi:hypothetical protein